MKKFEVFKESVEISKKDYAMIESGCVLEYRGDHFPEKIKTFDNLDDAKKFLEGFKSLIADRGSCYLVEEYYVQENDYEYDEDLEIWEAVDASGDVWEISKMTIELIEKPSYECVGVFDNMRDAKRACDDFEGECFLSF